MRLSTILELLLIFLIIAFSAYCTDARVINDREARAVRKKQSAVVSLKQATESVNKYCRCSDNICNCCRDFDIPLVKLPGPGCASLQYIPDDKLAMQLSVGENILSTNIVNGKNPKPVCVNLPGGFSKFCGKVYNIQREEDKHFKACLGLELQSTSDELEATLRVSCFRFGPDGLKLRPAEPYPTVLTKEPSTAADDDYEDIFGLGDDDEDDEDDEDYEKVSPEDPAANETQAQEGEDQEEDDEDDILGFSALLDLITGGDDTPAKKKQPKGTTTTTTTTTLIPSNFLIPIIATSSQKPVTSKTPAAVLEDAVTPENSDVQKTQSESVTIGDIEADTTFDPFEDTTRIESDNGEEDSTAADYGVTEEPAPAPANKVAPAKVNAPKPTTEKAPVKVKKTQVLKKKVSLTSQSVNAINDVKKPAVQHQESSEDDDEDQDDEYDYSDSSADDDDDDEDDSSNEDTKHEETDKDEETNAQEEYEDDDDDDDDEEEDAVLTALVGGEDSEKEETKKKPVAVKQTTTKKSTDVQEDESDYEGLAELLARNHPTRPEAKGTR